MKTIIDVGEVTIHVSKEVISLWVPSSSQKKFGELFSILTEIISQSAICLTKSVFTTALLLVDWKYLTVKSAMRQFGKQEDQDLNISNLFWGASSSVGRASDSGSRSPGIETRAGHEAEVRGSKPVLGTWWWSRIPPNQPYPKGAATAATTTLAKW